MRKPIACGVISSARIESWTVVSMALLQGVSKVRQLWTALSLVKSCCCSSIGFPFVQSSFKPINLLRKLSHIRVFLSITFSSRESDSIKSATIVQNINCWGQNGQQQQIDCIPCTLFARGRYQDLQLVMKEVAVVRCSSIHMIWYDMVGALS
jgi:hypothetical protein